jgi:hypothetical protein
MNRRGRIEIDFDDDIEQALERFGDHEDMSRARVVRWLEQFPDRDLPLAVEVIREIKYFNGLNIRTMTRHLFAIINDEMVRLELEKGAFIAVGSLGAGSGHVARVLRDLVRATRHRMLSMLDLSKLKPGEVDAIIFVDDFSGTGQTLEKWWEIVEPLVRPKNAIVFVGLLVLNERARERIESFANILAVEEVEGTANIFAPENRQFSEDQRIKLLEHCRRTGCGPKYERGFGDCGLLLAFKHFCPNNSLPILWCQVNWRPLFKRRAI